MEELLAAIRELGEPDFADWIFNAGSLVLAAAALYQAHVVSRGQDRIALFNIRYDAFFELNCLLDFAQHLRENAGMLASQPQRERLSMELAAFNAEFATDLQLAVGKPREEMAAAQVNVLRAVRAIEKAIKASQFATKDLSEREMERLMNALRRYLLQVITDGRDYNKALAHFLKCCDEFRADHFARAIARTRLYSSFSLPGMTGWRRLGADRRTKDRKAPPINKDCSLDSRQRKEDSCCR